MLMPPSDNLNWKDRKGATNYVSLSLVIAETLKDLWTKLKTRLLSKIKNRVYVQLLPSMLQSAVSTN